MKISPKLSKYAALAVGMSLFAADAAFAAAASNTQVLNDSCTTLNTIRKWLFNIAYLLGAIGLVIIAVSAFLGRFKFSHLIALGGGLFIVAMADLFIKFVTGGDSQGNSCTTV